MWEAGRIGTASRSYLQAVPLPRIGLDMPPVLAIDSSPYLIV